MDSVLEASGYSDIDEAIGILWDMIKEVWWWIDGVVCVRSYCLHNNIYPIGRHFRATSMEGISSDLGVGQILHQSKFLQVDEVMTFAVIGRFIVRPVIPIHYFSILSYINLFIS